MSKISSWAALSIAFLAACGSPRQPQPPLTSSPVFTADGRVLGVERGSPEDPSAYVRLVVVTQGDQPVHVELGPGWYLDAQGLRFSNDDLVSVEGRRELRAGKSVVVARRVRKGTESVELRDQFDRPAWER